MQRQAMVVSGAISVLVLCATLLTPWHAKSLGWQGQSEPEPEPPASAPLAQQRPDAPALLVKFNRSASYRSLFDDVIDRPQQGGYLLASAILGVCKKFTVPLEPIQTTNPAQANARAQMAARCAMTEQNYADASAQWAYERKFHARRDPLLSLAYDLWEAHSEPARAAAIGAILESGNPFGIEMLLRDDDLDGGAVKFGARLFFAGHWYEGEDAIGRLRDAMALAHCDLGLECGAHASATLKLCAERGWCGDSVADALRRGLDAKGGAHFHPLAKLAGELAKEIRNKNVSAFLAPPLR